MPFQLVKTLKSIKSIPTEQGSAPRVTYIDSRGVTYIITSDMYRKLFVCWRVDNNKYVKMATADSPLPLYDFIEKEQKKKYVPIA